VRPKIRFATRAKVTRPHNGDGCCEEGKMEWVIALIVLLIVPLWIVLWWIPHCDAIGIQKAKVN
jgi:hypothetical protein